MKETEATARRRLTQSPPAQGLYDPQNEHDACGVGFLVNITGEKTHSIIEKGVVILKNLLHRGATGADAETGDGAGLLFQIPDEFFQKKCKELAISLPSAGAYGVGMFFMPREDKLSVLCREMVEQVVSEEGLQFLGWREVPVDEQALGEKAREEMPFIVQCFVSGLSGMEMERKLYVIRKQCEQKTAPMLGEKDLFYVPSFSCETIVYKGLMLPNQVAPFYPDLTDPDLKSALAIVHQRYSTNTFPSWPLAQPW